MPDKICSQSGLIQEFLDARTDKKLKSILDAHLKDCAACREEFAQFESLFQSLDDSLKIPKIHPDSAAIEKMRKAVVLRRPSSNEKSVAWFEKIFAGFFKPALALGVVLLIVSFVIFRNMGSIKTDRVAPTVAQAGFNLEKNSVDVVLALDSALVKADERMIKITELKTCEAEQTYAFPENSVVVLHSGSSKIKLSRGARFRLNRSSFELFHGTALFSLKGDHSDFELKTELATVSVIGTEFEAQVADNQLSVKLFSGKIVIKTSNGSVMQLDKPMQRVVVDRQGSFVRAGKAEESGTLPAVPQQPDPQPSNSDSGGNLENTF